MTYALTGFESISQRTASAAHSFWMIPDQTSSASPLTMGIESARSSVGHQQTLRAAVEISNEQRFASLATQWSKETGAHSSLTVRQRHPAYQAIISMGRPAVPLLLKALQSMPDYWFPALCVLTGENPVAPEDRGAYDRMTEAWQSWGRERGLI